MRDTQRELLLSTAERLFAERGVDATSLRAVMAEAGTNVAAVNYHFGSKDALLAEVIRSRSGALRAEREELLAALEADEEPGVHGLAEAIVAPVAALALRGEDGWIRLVNSIVATRRDPGWTLLNETFAPQADRLAAVLLRIHPDLRRATVRFRMAEATSMPFRVLGDLADAVAAVLDGPSPASA